MKIKCIYCEKEFSKYGIKNHIATIHFGKIQGNKGKHQIAWNKGLTEKTDERVKKSHDTLRKNYKSGLIIPSFKDKKHTKETKTQISIGRKKFCENIEERKRLQVIGRKGGYGKKGYTQNGTYYSSNFEKLCFECLEENKIKFEAHKLIPNSSKVSDIYLIEKDLWIELDGINREQKKKYIGKNYDYWLEKLRIYEDQKLIFKIYYNFEDFKADIPQWSNGLDL